MTVIRDPNESQRAALSCFEMETSVPVQSPTEASSSTSDVATSHSVEDIEDMNADPWVERYRPKSINAICGQPSITRLFEEIQRNNQPMHFLFYGPPGTGKTSTILSFCTELYGNQPRREHYVMEINASVDCGINMVREKIKPFCKQSITPFTSGSHRVDYKFVILDEADTLTIEAQTALRRCIEVYSYNTRFCFLCNYVNQIISPILSRCFVCHFQPLSEEASITRLQEICAEESIGCEDGLLEAMFTTYNGDLRASISTLQAMSSMYDTLTCAAFRDYIGEIPTNFWETFSEMQKTEIPSCVDTLIQRSYSVRVLLRSFIQWSAKSLEPAKIYQIYQRMSRWEKQSLHSQDNRLLIFEVVYFMHGIIRGDDGSQTDG